MIKVWFNFYGDLAHFYDQRRMDWLKKQYAIMINSQEHSIIDEGFAVALVQIGMKNYDGGFWPHVAKELGVKTLPPHQTIWIGDSFYNTLRKNDKFNLGRGEWVNNVLMHGFVSDYYAENFLNFLFAFYRLDLERDLSRTFQQFVVFLPSE